MNADPSHSSIVIAGGGTGGHLMPGLAVAEELRRAGARRIVFVGTARGIEARLVQPAGYELRLIQVGGLKGRGLGRRIATMTQLPRAIGECIRLLRECHASVVFGIGGYASGPALAAAALLRIPVVLLEVNARSGLANRWAARWAKAAAVNFPETGRDFRRAVVTGIPVRPEFFTHRGALPPPGQPVVLVFGGSQGAHALNQAVSVLPPGPYRLRHQSGAHDFIHDMAGAMAEASVVVCRAGASTLGELAAVGRAAILVPFPAAADQHQLRNAQAFAKAGAAVLLPQSELTPASLATAIEELLAQPERRRGMEAAARRFAHPDAARAIAALVLDNQKKG
ncbi:MAG TPA: UDP-N-acetylglucosamine--N-acetylmuramyl-(pentapeptide) pyrophosphoryl-undecaprenol N-acetylglucosamine transferase [Terriglobales bacterium]|nr:UDP-N-acetylglucosamine--N-acetylmuramyl-(pentapeptide) pyrophosphoryl-undecaprenol N-acetylglucosamine transferase [Terriglobales bacterium]